MTSRHRAHRRLALASSALLGVLSLSPASWALEWELVTSPTRSGDPTPTQTDSAAAPSHELSEDTRAQRTSGSSSGLAWELVIPGEELIAAPDPAQEQILPPTLEELRQKLKTMAPSAADYRPLVEPLRIGQMPTAFVLPDDQLRFSAEQVSPTDGGAGGGTGNQNYAVRGDVMLNERLMVSGFWSYADDPLYKEIIGPDGQPRSTRSNFWTAWGGSARLQLTSQQQWSLAIEGSLERFSVGSGCDSPGSCSDSSPGGTNIFNNSGQKVYTDNFVGSVSFPLSWQASPNLHLSLTPLAAFLPSRQGGGQGGAGDFYGTNIAIGLGASYQLSNKIQLFSSTLFPLGPGKNAFNDSLNYERVPIYSAGALVALNPRIGFDARITNGFGLSPATAILALPSAPYKPMVGARLVWNPAAPDSAEPLYSGRQAGMALGGLSVNTALTPVAGTTQLWSTADSTGSLWGSASYSVSNDFQAQIFAGAVEPGSDPNDYVKTFVGDGTLNLRFGGKAMFHRPTQSLPVWLGGRITAGRAGGGDQAIGGQGNLFAELMGSWEATPSLAFHLNPKLSWSGSGTSWGVGAGANIQLAERLQLLPEVNLVATDLGGSNGTNASLGLRWLASSSTTVDVYISNAMGIVDLTQLISSDEPRLGAKITVQF